MSRRRVHLALAVILLSSTSGWSAEPRTARSEVIATLAPGPLPSDLSEEPCEEDCTAGFAMLGPNDGVYFYDFGNNNIKVIPLHSPNRPRTVIDGLPVDPDDGVVLHDGAIYLLMDRWNGGPLEAERFAIFWRPAREQNWVEARLLIEGEGATKSGLITYESTVVFAITNGDVYIANKNGMSIQVASSDGLVDLGQPLAWARRDLPGWSTRKAGRLMGPDSGGRMYSLHIQRNNTVLARRLDREGNVLATIELPSRPTTMRFVGKGHILVSPRGTLLGLQVTEEALQINEMSFD